MKHAFRINACLAVRGQGQGKYLDTPQTLSLVWCSSEWRSKCGTSVEEEEEEKNRVQILMNHAPDGEEKC
jgi:hypothetical protein